MLGPPPPARLACAACVGVIGLLARAAGAQEPPPPGYVAPPSPSPLAALATPADPITLDLGLHAGLGVRFSDSAGVPIAWRSGGVVGVSVAVSPSRSYAVGLGYEHSALGSEHGAGAVADAAIIRSLDVLWGSLRLSFLRGDRFLLLAQLGPGLAFQHVDANVLVYQGAGLRPTGFSCQETGGPGLALRAGLGVEARVHRALWFNFDVLVDNLRLSSDALGACAPGAGSVSLIGLRTGFTYRLDVSRALR